MRSPRLAAALLVAACASRARVPPRPPPDDGRFVVRFAPGRAAPSYDADSLRERVARLAPEDFTVALRADAVARYVSDIPPASCVVLHLTPEGAAGLRAQRRDAGAARRLDDVLDGAVFVVELDGQQLYAGQVWFEHGAAAFDTPAMHVLDDATGVRLALAPSQGLWTRVGPGGRSPIDQRGLRAYFTARGAFEELRRCAPP